MNVLGFQTHRDHFAIDFERERLRERIAEMRSDWLSDEQFRAKYGVQDNRDWQLSAARSRLRRNDAWEEDLIDCLYRPFDWRPCYFSEIAMDYPRRELTQHLLLVGQHVVLPAVGVAHRFVERAVQRVQARREVPGGGYRRQHRERIGGILAGKTSLLESPDSPYEP